MKDGGELTSLAPAGYSGTDGAERYTLLRPSSVVQARRHHWRASSRQGQHRQVAGGREIYNRLNGDRAEGQKLIADVAPARHPRASCSTTTRCTRRSARPSRASTPCWRTCRRARARPASCSRTRRCTTTRDTVAEMRRLLADLNAGKGTRRANCSRTRNCTSSIRPAGRAAGHHARPAELRPGHARAVDGQPAAVRIAQRHHAGDAGAGEGHPRQPEEVPDASSWRCFEHPKTADRQRGRFRFHARRERRHRRGAPRGILTATTLMANGAAFDDAVRLARETPALDVGCHLVLVGGRSVLDGAGRCRRPSRNCCRPLARREIRSTTNCGAGATHLAAGLRRRHLDTHKHTHLLPAGAGCGGAHRARNSASPGCGGRSIFRSTRRARCRGPSALVSRGHRAWCGGASTACCAAHGCRTTDHFAGFQITGRFRTAELVALIGPARRDDRIHEPSGLLHRRIARRAHAPEGEPRARARSAHRARNQGRARPPGVELTNIVRNRRSPTPYTRK